MRESFSANDTIQEQKLETNKKDVPCNKFQMKDKKKINIKNRYLLTENDECCLSLLHHSTQSLMLHPDFFQKPQGHLACFFSRNHKVI